MVPDATGPELHPVVHQVISLAPRSRRLLRQEVADQLNLSGQKLVEQHPGQSRNTGDFTWHTQTRLYPVLPGDMRPGEEFMKAAFSTPVGEAGVSADGLRENVYVIQPVRKDERTEGGKRFTRARKKLPRQW